MKKEKVYLDNAATTQPSKAVFQAMQPFLFAKFGNPSSLHEFGVQAKQGINTARETIAQILNASPQEIIFTSGGTESINLALFGMARQYQLDYKQAGHIIVSSIEHEAVLESAKALQTEGWKIDYLPVNKFGVVNPKDINKLIKKNTVLISVMYANNETGSIQPIAEIGKTIIGINRARLKKKLPAVLFHTDGCQAGGILDLNIQKLKVDLLTINGSKINGPKGSGLLFKRQGVNLRPILFGGGQEFGLRSGTENTASIVGLATALQESTKLRDKKVKQLFSLQTYLETNLLDSIEGLVINGPRNIKLNPKQFNFSLTKLPSSINISIKGVEGEALMYYLDANGFAVATGSACTTSSTDPSHVLIAMGLKPKQAYSTIRISLSSDTKKTDLKRFTSTLKKIVKMLQNTEHNL